MIGIGGTTSAKVLQLLIAPEGLNASIGTLTASTGFLVPQIPEQHIFTDNVSSDLAETTVGAKYTAVYVYCEKIANVLREKFRGFSGRIQMAVEVRVSQDRLEGLDKKLQLYTDAVTQVLGQSRGDWGQGLFYAGAYEVNFSAVKHGGRNFIKAGKIIFQVDASVN
jgi:hypothetical protein